MLADTVVVSSRYVLSVERNCIFKVVFSCAVSLELKFVGGPSYFLLSDILVRINGQIRSDTEC